MKKKYLLYKRTFRLFDQDLVYIKIRIRNLYLTNYFDI